MQEISDEENSELNENGIDRRHKFSILGEVLFQVGYDSQTGGGDWR